jgi:hypothetical protein
VSLSGDCTRDFVCHVGSVVLVQERHPVQNVEGVRELQEDLAWFESALPRSHSALTSESGEPRRCLKVANPVDF